MKALLFAALLTFAFDAAADPLVLRWIAPADTTDIRDYRIRIGRCGADLNYGFRIVDKQFTSATMDVPADGRLYCAQIVAMAVDNSESPPTQFIGGTSFPVQNFSMSVTVDKGYVPIDSSVLVTWSASATVVSCARWVSIAGVASAETPVPTAGTETVGPLTGTLLFVLSCRDASGYLGVESVATATYRPVQSPVVP